MSAPRIDLDSPTAAISANATTVPMTLSKTPMLQPSGMTRRGVGTASLVAGKRPFKRG